MNHFPAPKFVIFICNFNLFPDTGRHRYSFRNICVEDRELELGDGTEKVFLCTKGADEDISPDLKALLDYVAGNVPESDFARRLESAVVDARKNPQWRKEYMDLQDYVDDARKEGIEEGIKKGIEKGKSMERAQIIKTLSNKLQISEHEAVDLVTEDKND